LGIAGLRGPATGSENDQEVKLMLNRYVVELCWIGLLVMGSVTAQPASPSAEPKAENPAGKDEPVFRVAGVRYQVKDVERSLAFYTGHLGFQLVQRSGPAFASVSKGGLILWLSGPKSSGSRPMPDGRQQEPGGWNRLALEVDDLPSVVAAMKKEGFRFRNEIETGPGGKQIQLEDPDGNPVELFEPAR
jgi:glyoxylase I family protein